MVKKIVFFVVFFGFCNNLLFSQSVQFTFNTLPYNIPTVVNPLLTASPLSVNAGTLLVNLTTGEYFTNEPYVGSTGGWGATQVNLAKRFSFNVDVKIGYAFIIDSLSVQGYATASGPNRCAFVVNNTVFDTFSITSSVLFNYKLIVNNTDSLTSSQINLIGFNTGQTSGSGDFRIDNLNVYCTIFPIPLPDSNTVIATGPMAEPIAISSLVSANPGIPVLDFMITDSATTDALPTIIDSLVFDVMGEPTEVGLNEIIGGALLTGNGLALGLEGILYNNRVVFNTNKLMQIENGSTATYQLSLWLKEGVLLPDNYNLSLQLQTLHCYTDPSGSSVGFGTVALNPFVIEVQATQLKTQLPNGIWFADSVFTLQVMATDLNGNVDVDFMGDVVVASSSVIAEIVSESGLSSPLMNGKTQFTDLKFTNSDSTTLSISCSGLPTIETTIAIVKPLFTDLFDSHTLQNWYNVNEWTVSNDERLKHNLTNIPGTSYIASTVGLNELNHGTTFWRFVLQNGDFDPTSSNRFWYYIMATDSNLTDSENSGYVVGVNFSGSTDTLSLWRVDAGSEKTLLTTTSLNWEPNQKTGIEVSRSVKGEFKVGVNPFGNFESLSYTQSVTDSTYQEAIAQGLVFNFTNTRAGMLWADDVLIATLNTAPVIKTAIALTNTHLEVYFSEELLPVLTADISKFTLINNGGEAIPLNSLEWNASNPERVILHVSSLKTGQYSLLVNGLFDTDSLPMSNQSIKFWFESQSKPFDVVFNEVMFDPSPSVGLPEYDFLTIVNRGNDAYNLKDWTMEVNGIRKALPNQYIQVNQEVVITSSTALDAFLPYGTAITGISSTALTIGRVCLKLYTASGILSDSLTYNSLWITDEAKQDGGWSLERVDVNNLCSGLNNWKASVNPNGGTPGLANSVSSTNIDNTPPRLVEIDLVTPKLVDLVFTEPIDLNSASGLQNYIVSNSIGRPDSVWLQEFPATFRLQFAKSLQSGMQYSLRLKNITDECQNPIQDTLLPLSYYLPQPNDIVFNEIMADAKPSVNLPEVQYIELYNLSNKTIELTGFKLQYSTYFKEFENVMIKPNSYLLLCPAGQGNNLDEYGQVVDLLSTTTLTASGRELQLIDTSGNIIARVNYSADWYRNPDKVDGGWSLERIDPENHCSEGDNWQASVNPKGGTPGARNSVYGAYIDAKGPKIVNVKAISEREISVKFTEPVSEAALSNFEAFGLNNNLNVVGLKFGAKGRSELILQLSGETILETQYHLSVKTIADACGNLMTDTLIKVVRTNLNWSDVVISELMVDPVPAIELPEFEYIELFNRTNYSVSLDRLTLTVNNTKRKLPEFDLEAGHYVILCAESALTEFTKYGKVLAIESFVTMPNTLGNLVLADTLGNSVHKLQYSIDWYHNKEKEDGGYSLEMVDPNNLCGNISNYKASENKSGGTPGQQNSVYGLNSDTEAPMVKNILAISANVLVVEFSEQADTLTLLNPANYTVTDLGNPQQIKVDSVNPKFCFLTFDLVFEPATEYTLLIKRIADYCGNIMEQVSLPVRFEMPVLYDVVINEVLCKPLGTQNLPYPEFIEVYNRTNKILPMYKWSLMVNNWVWSIDATVIEPNGYLLLSAPTAVSQLAQMGKCAVVPTWTDLPTNASVTLLNGENFPMAVLEYKQDWIADEIQYQGGYSLERINTETTDATIANWKVSNNQNGGTPGFKNSVFTASDGLPAFELEQVLPVSNNRLKLSFNKVIDATKLDINHFSVKDFAGICTDAVVSASEFKSIELTFSQPFNYGILYTLNVSADFTGFKQQALANPSEFFALPDSTDIPKIILNEILFNPPTGGADFVELYNNSQSFYNLAGISLASKNTDGTVTGIKPMIPSGYLLFPGQWVVFTTNADWVRKQYIENGQKNILNVDALPSLSDDKGNIVLINNSTIIDELNYTDDMHFQLLSTAEGVSLERIYYDQSTNDASNWHSASQTAGWGTPGLINSVYSDSPEKGGDLTIDPKVFSPDNDGFDDRVNFYYNFNEPGYVANIVIFSVKGGIVRKLASNVLLQPEGQFTWDGLTDDGRLVPVGMYVVYFEVFNLKGEVKKFKRVCVVASKFE